MWKFQELLVSMLIGLEWLKLIETEGGHSLEWGEHFRTMKEGFKLRENIVVSGNKAIALQNLE